MSKSFTCRELMGICDEKISGDTFNEIIQKGMQHMQSDDAHKKHMESHADHTEEDRKKWFSEMEKAFDEKLDDE